MRNIRMNSDFIDQGTSDCVSTGSILDLFNTFLKRIRTEDEDRFVRIHGTFSPEVTTMLSEHPEWINTASFATFTPLSEAIKFNREFTGILLWKFGAENIPNKGGYTPFWYAINHGCDLVVKAFFEAGMQIDITPDQQGFTLLHLAAKSRNELIVRLLFQFMPQMFIDRKLFNVQTTAGFTPLHYAVQSGNEFIIKLFLQFGSSAIDIATYIGRTPLRMACEMYHPTIISILRAVGAKIDPISAEWVDMFGQNIAPISPKALQLSQSPIEEETILQIRREIYFQHSLLSTLILTGL